ncbi:hypothetical protein N7481_009804 [Penicillium waksmanii]|uniref:uncharacterized protein n=1 Tax=Penicillium waksmanii TaxID=69791 RepID=UPI002547A935|nr:uncharacterized protein N7481_009804 [Penicillium waksmanii]KAJ5976097.1 hypothetical protein N7481_009804 [Penicillium waksmanii]
MVTGVYIAQAIGTIGCAAAAGGIATLSIACIPNLTLPARRPAKSSRSFYETPGNLAAHLSHQWLDFYDRGHKIFPSVAGLSSLANIYVFWALRDTPTEAVSSVANHYLLAAAVAMSIAPWTVLAMLKTNKTLDSYAASDDEGGAEDVKDTITSTEEQAKRSQADNEVPRLLKKWAKLNLVRSIFPLLGAAISLHATSRIISSRA